MVIADTGFWLALGNRRDSHHGRAKAALSELKEPLVTTWTVMTETCHLLSVRVNIESQHRFVESFAAGAFQVFILMQGHADHIYALMRHSSYLRKN